MKILEQIGLCRWITDRIKSDNHSENKAWRDLRTERARQHKMCSNAEVVRQATYIERHEPEAEYDLIQHLSVLSFFAQQRGQAESTPQINIKVVISMLC